MKISDNCLALVAKWEGFRDKAYLCPAGVWTIGYGTTRWSDGSAVKKGQTITKEKAWELFRIQVQQHASTIEQYVKVELNQNQYDALASFQYNLGKYILKGSTLLTHLNNKDWDKAAEQMSQYNKATVNGKKTVLKGLVNRRNEEVALFKKPIEVSIKSIIQEEIRMFKFDKTAREDFKKLFKDAHKQGIFSTDHSTKVDTYDDEKLYNLYLSYRIRKDLQK